MIDEDQTDLHEFSFYQHMKGIIKDIVLLSSFVPKKTMLAAL